VADAGDGPEEEGPDVARNGGWEGVEGLRAGPDHGDGGLGVEGEEVEGIDHLGSHHERLARSGLVYRPGRDGVRGRREEGRGVR
jgi:hypothetical protein